MVTAALALLLTAGAVALTTDSGTCDVQIPDNTTSRTCDGLSPEAATNKLANGTIVSYIGDNDTSLGSSGTGIFESFVRIQATPSESGYNTDGKLELDTKAGKWTHSIEVSEIPVVTIAGQQYWELFADINENNSTPKIVLTDVEVWFTLNPDITGYGTTVFTDDADLIYDFQGQIVINDVNQGSGRGDLRYLIPLSGITIPADCAYGSTTCETYFVLYSQWGTDPTSIYASDGGFEEWKVKVYPVAATQLKNTEGTTTTTDDTNITDGSSVAIGTGVYDTATLSNTTSTTDDGTLSYYYLKQTTTTATCTGGTLIGSVTVTNGVALASATVTLTSAGTYEFWAVYTTGLDVTTTSTCGSETVVVPLNTTTAATQLKNTEGTTTTTDDTNITDGSSVAIGTVVYDTATLSGQTATAGGTVSYYYLKQTTTTATCTGGTLIGSVTVTNGVALASATVTLTSAGTYEFWAVYSGDLNNITSTSTCGSETVVVRTSPAPHSTPVVQIKDTLNVTGFTADATGNVLVGLYSDATCTTRVTGTSDESFAVTGLVGSSGVSTTFTVVTAGDYYYKISYAGDPKNSSFSSCVEKVGVTITSVP